jgi:hypothetical protein
MAQPTLSDLARGLQDQVNDPNLTPAKRIEALELLANTREILPGKRRGEVNNHVHTIYSFSPYTPEMTVVKAFEAGLEAVGSVDHDSITAARTFGQAGRIFGMAVTSGFEVRVRWTDPRFAKKKLNYPDCTGRAYIVAHGIPQQSWDKAEAWISPLREARIERTREMTQGVSQILESSGIGTLDFDTQVIPLTKLNEAGGITERHMLGAAALVIMNKAVNDGVTLSNLLHDRLSISSSSKIASLLDDAQNPHRYYDLLGVLKTTLIDQVWIDPSDQECPTAEEATAFIRSLGGIPAYAYLGDVGESPTGDKKAEFFEDSFLDEFMESVKSTGFLAVTYMPPRNTKDQLLRVQKLCAHHELMEISGVDINSSRQVFTCPEILQPEFQHLNTSTWALIAHELLASQNLEWSLFHPNNPLASVSLEQRIKAYGASGLSMDPKNPQSIRKPWDHRQGGNHYV